MEIWGKQSRPSGPTRQTFSVAAEGDLFQLLCRQASLEALRYDGHREKEVRPSDRALETRQSVWFGCELDSLSLNGGRPAKTRIRMETETEYDDVRWFWHLKWNRVLPCWLGPSVGERAMGKWRREWRLGDGGSWVARRWIGGGGERRRFWWQNETKTERKERKERERRKRWVRSARWRREGKEDG